MKFRHFDDFKKGIKPTQKVFVLHGKWIHNHPTCNLFIIDPDPFSDVGLYYVLSSCRRMTARRSFRTGCLMTVHPIGTHWTRYGSLQKAAKASKNYKRSSAPGGVGRPIPPSHTYAFQYAGIVLPHPWLPAMLALLPHRATAGRPYRWHPCD